MKLFAAALDGEKMAPSLERFLVLVLNKGRTPLLRLMFHDFIDAGIMMDTKNFTFKTGVRTFEAAAFLRKSGVDIIKVKKWFQTDLETYKKIMNIIEKTEIVNFFVKILDKYVFLC